MWLNKKENKVNEWKIPLYKIFTDDEDVNLITKVIKRGTEWAIGTLDEIDNLSFDYFRNAVSRPKNVVGKNLVLHLIEDNIYLTVKFISWSQGKRVGFSYERSTP